MKTPCLRLDVLIILCSIFLILINSSCNEPFIPAAPFEPRMIIYSVLSNVSDTQYVRIYSTYNPPNNDPSQNPEENSVTDARVTVSDGATTYTFRDTSIQRPDQSRYKSPIHLYYSYPFKAEPGKTYVLNVTSPTHGRATASTTMPGKGLISFYRDDVLEMPGQRWGTPVEINFLASNLSKALLIRFYVVYTAENPWEQEENRSRERIYEVPLRRVILDPNYQRCRIIYPGMQKTEVKFDRSGKPTSSRFTYPFMTYNLSIYHIRYFNFNPQFKRAVTYLIQFDGPSYKYYSDERLFTDRFTVRLDSPDYTNIDGGAGLFGCVRVDSAQWVLPAFINPVPDGFSGQLSLCTDNEIIIAGTNQIVMNPISGSSLSLDLLGSGSRADAIIQRRVTTGVDQRTNPSAQH